MLHIVYIALCVGTLTSCQSTSAAITPIPLHFGYVIASNNATVPAVDLALQKINNNPSLLTGYVLQYRAIQDSRVCALYCRYTVFVLLTSTHRNLPVDKQCVSPLPTLVYTHYNFLLWK